MVEKRRRAGLVFALLIASFLFASQIPGSLAAPNNASLSSDSLQIPVTTYDDGISAKSIDSIENETNSTASSASILLKSASSVIAHSGSNRYVVWTDYTPGNLDVLFKRSTDGGASWKPVVNLSNNPGGSGNAAIASSAANVYVVWTQYNLALDRADTYVRVSIDSGVTWGAKIKLSTTGDNVGVHPQVAASGSNAYVVWSESGDNIVLRRSTDNGQSWGIEVPISSSDDRSSEPQVAASGTNVYVFWQYDVPSAGNSDIMFRRSSDSGASWKSAVNLSNNDGNSELPRIALAGTNLYVVWKDPTPGNADVLFKRSTNNGISWGATINISANKGRSENPQVAASGTNVYVAWEQSNSPPTVTDVLVRASTDSGVNWGAKTRLSTTGENHGSMPQLAASGSNAYVVWSDSGIEIFISKTTDSGVSWGEAENISKTNPGISDTAYVTASGTRVHVVWNDNQPGNYDIMFKRSLDSGTTWKSTVNLSSNPKNSLLIEQPT